MKILGYLLLIAGIVALVITGLNYINETEHFRMMGLEVTVSEASVWPMIVSLLVALVGVLLLRKKG